MGACGPLDEPLELEGRTEREGAGLGVAFVPGGCAAAALSITAAMTSIVLGRAARDRDSCGVYSTNDSHLKSQPGRVDSVATEAAVVSNGVSNRPGINRWLSQSRRES
jgi:hypothetical protein